MPRKQFKNDALKVFSVLIYSTNPIIIIEFLYIRIYKSENRKMLDTFTELQPMQIYYAS
jgi:hypothetical protein